MAFFPFFVDIEDKQCLIVGGGQVARRKVEKLLPYGVRITVVSESFCPELLREERIQRVQHSFCADDLAAADFVIAATGDRAVNETISRLCTARKLPVNTVDDPALCSFYFPALIKEGPLSIGISTGGYSPALAALLKEQLASALPEDVEALLSCCAALRREIRELSLPETVCAKCISCLSRQCLSEGRAPDEAAIRQTIKAVKQESEGQ